MLENWKRRMAERVKAAELRRSGGTPDPAPFHSRAYHRNFQGYTEVKTLDQKGRTVIQRVYTGKYYEPALEPFRRITLRFFYLLFFLGGAALFLFCSTRSLPCNSVFYVGVFQALVILPLLWCVYVLVFYIPSTGKLTMGEYETQHKPLIRAALSTAVCMWACAVSALACFFVDAGDRTPGGLLCAAGFAASGGLIFLISLFERSLEYTVTDSTAVPSEDGTEIE